MRFVLIFAFLFAFIEAFAQDSVYFSRFSVTVKPLGIIDPILPNLTGGIQIRASKRILVELQGGIIHSWNNASFDGQEKISKKGFKLSAEIKYLAFKNIYFSILGFFNNFLKSDNEYVWRLAKNYQEKINLTRKKQVIGGHIKFGYLLPRPGRRFYYDFFAGIGLRQRYLELTNLPEDAETNHSGQIAPDITGKQILPSLSLGVNIGFKVWK